MQSQPKNLQKAKIYDLITSKFGNIALYKLKDEYINDNGKPKNMIEIPTNEISDETFNNMFDPIPIANLSMYKYASKQEYSCVFIKGYGFVTPESNVNLDIDADNDGIQ